MLPGRPQLIFLDALDEAEGNAFQRIPENLPAGVYVVATSRPAADRFVLARRQHLHWFDLDSPDLLQENLADGFAFVQRELAASDLPRATLEEMARVGAGNFLVLQLLCRHVGSALGPAEVGAFLRRLAADGGADRLGFIYGEFWQRLTAQAGQNDANLLCDAAGVLAAAHAPLTAEVVVEALGLRGGDWDLALRRLAEYLTVVAHEDGGVGETFYRLYHESFADFLRARLAAGGRRVRDQLADYALRWARLPEGYARTYALRFGPRHLLEAGRGEEAAALLLDLPFLEAKAAAGLAFELTGDFTAAARALPVYHPQRRLLGLLEEALRRDVHFIARHAADYPQGLFQCLWNNAWWYDCPDAARHVEPPEGGWAAAPVGTIRRAAAPAPGAPRAAKERDAPGFVWLRACGRPRSPSARPCRRSCAGTRRRRPPWPGRRTGRGSPARRGTARCGCGTRPAASPGTSWSGPRTVYAPWPGRLMGPVWPAGARTGPCASGTPGPVRRPPCWSGTRTASAASRSPRTGRQWLPGPRRQRADMGRRHRPGAGRVGRPRGHVRQRLSRGVGRRLVAGRPAHRQRGARPDGAAVGRGRGTASRRSPRPRRTGFGGGVFARRPAPAQRRGRPHGPHLGRRRRPSARRPPRPHQGDAARGRQRRRPLRGVLSRRAQVAAGTNDGEVFLFDAAAGARLAVLRGHEGQVSGLAFAPDGPGWPARRSTARCASGARRPAGRRRSPAGTAGVGCSTSAMRRTARRLATCAADGTVRVWDAATGEQRAVLVGHERSVFHLAWSPDGAFLAGGSEDHTVRVWDGQGGPARAVLRGHESLVSRVAYSPNGAVIASASADDTVRLWDAITGEERAVLRGHAGSVCCLA